MNNTDYLIKYLDPHHTWLAAKDFQDGSDRIEVKYMHSDKIMDSLNRLDGNYVYSSPSKHDISSPRTICYMQSKTLICEDERVAEIRVLAPEGNPLSVDGREILGIFFFEKEPLFGFREDVCLSMMVVEISEEGFVISVRRGYLFEAVSRKLIGMLKLKHPDTSSEPWVNLEELPF